MKKISVLSIICLALCGWRSQAQTYDTNGDFVQTFAGSAFTGYVDGQGQATMFNQPSKVVADSSGNLFVEDIGNSVLRKITPSGLVSTFAGGGTHAMPGFGTNENISLVFSSAMITDHADNVFFGGYPNSLTKIMPSGYCSAFTPTNYVYGSPLCCDSVNNIYYSYGNKIYICFTNGTSQAFVGSGNNGSIDGNGIFTSFASPSAMTCDGADNIWVWESGSLKVRRVNQNKDVTTLAGVSLNSVTTMAFDSAGNLYFNSGGEWIGKIDPKTNITILAGSTTQTGYTNGIGQLARFNQASGFCLSGGVIYVADSGNQRIRMITNNPAPQIVSAGNMSVANYPGLTITGVVGRTYQIQASTNMVNWTTSATLVLNSSPYLWIDQSPDGTKKFYRASILP